GGVAQRIDRRADRAGRRLDVYASASPAPLRSAVAPHQADHHSANGDVVRRLHYRLHRRVGRLQPNHPIRLAIELFDGRIAAADQRDDGLAVVGAVAALDDDVVAVANAVLDHRIALDPQAERVVAAHEILGHADSLAILDCLDRTARGNLAKQLKMGDQGLLRLGRDLQRAAVIVLAGNETLELEIAEMLVNGRERREPEVLTDLGERRREAVLL